MVERRKLDYFLLRYVPNAVREEFVNIALVMTESGGDGGGFAGMRFTRDWRRARRVDPDIDVEVLEALGREMERRLSDVAERAKLLHEMMDSYSNLLQLSPMRHCLAEDPARELKDLASDYSWRWQSQRKRKEREPGRRAGRSGFTPRRAMHFERRECGMLDERRSGGELYKTGIRFRFRFRVSVGNEIKLFHAVSLRTSGGRGGNAGGEVSEDWTEDGEPEKGCAALHSRRRGRVRPKREGSENCAGIHGRREHSRCTFAGDEWDRGRGAGSVGSVTVQAKCIGPSLRSG